VDIEEIIDKRRSIRRYLPESVSVRDIRAILATACLAPSVSNRQMWRFIVISDANLLKMLGRLVERKINEMEKWIEYAGQPQKIQVWRDYGLHFTTAPAAIFVITQGYRTPLDKILVEHGMKYWETAHQFSYPEYQSIGCMLGFLTLAAKNKGYGTCIMTDPLFARKDLEASLELKMGEELAAIVSLGKPDENPPPRPRKAIDDLIEWR